MQIALISIYSSLARLYVSVCGVRRTLAHLVYVYTRALLCLKAKLVYAN